MDIKQLKYFYTIAEEGKITTAAKKLHIAQPPLSYQLKNLETELGVKLVERGSRNIKLTDAGLMLYNRAKQILNLTQTTIDELNDFKNGTHGTLSIGTVSSSGWSLVNNILIKFHKKYPLINFEIHEGNTYELLEILKRGIIEFAIVRTPFNSYGLNCIYLPKEPMVAVMREDFNYSLSNTTKISELKDKPLIFYRRFEKLIYEACENSNFRPKVFCKNDDARTTLLWASAGFGIAIVPKSVVSLGNSNLIYKKIEDASLSTQLAAIWPKNNYISSSAKNFFEMFNI
ncbi:DNA-binding transcriptional LysR family regulator [Clostridium acetobutylicum]|uniref:Transcriptional regulator, LysR family n=2 Tax=Bacteria TaxID=2 RepID=Q97GH3_CLOAB|nr:MULTISPECIES: LysR family transcriptional regulator [Clostridium]AAK80349.1 Transcriptional regulator, LysR family [Clostridium acetobutylicum ATCC 824]ADZ21446.1 Transcriptional regulator, LysR family [Clostridium acetobutylicum EA 2018]AEI34359.1 LysR family transcriptional regulator [Clostridium acetobutylicum DSM 1731]AWV79230.1 LysR family transcriptional regulator [Clostridium acetobutylicum]MBC2394803.1 LysR family transcriptional regulator [Clostridium acetobutylicum]